MARPPPSKNMHFLIINKHSICWPGPLPTASAPSFAPREESLQREEVHMMLARGPWKAVVQ